MASVHATVICTALSLTPLTAPRTSRNPWPVPWPMPPIGLVAPAYLDQCTGQGALTDAGDSSQRDPESDKRCTVRHRNDTERGTGPLRRAASAAHGRRTCLSTSGAPRLRHPAPSSRPDGWLAHRLARRRQLGPSPLREPSWLTSVNTQWALCSCSRRPGAGAHGAAIRRRAGGGGPPQPARVRHGQPLPRVRLGQGREPQLSMVIWSGQASHHHGLRTRCAGTTRWCASPPVRRITARQQNLAGRYR
jgi:hypothetical protein